MEKQHNSQRGLRYDNSIELYPIKEGEVYVLDNGSSITINDINNGVPSFMIGADCVFIDVPANTALLKGYYTKADLPVQVENFKALLAKIDAAVSAIQPRMMFMEFFNSSRGAEDMLRNLFPFVKVYNSMYYHSKKNPCYIAHCSLTPIQDIGIEGMDEEDAVYKICREVPFNTIADFMLGQGLVADAAFRAGKKFYGSDINRNRLAVAINRVAKRGGKWNVISK